MILHYTFLIMIYKRTENVMYIWALAENNWVRSHKEKYKKRINYYDPVYVCIYTLNRCPLGAIPRLFQSLSQQPLAKSFLRSSSPGPSQWKAFLDFSQGHQLIIRRDQNRGFLLMMWPAHSHFLMISSRPVLNFTQSFLFLSFLVNPRMSFSIDLTAVLNFLAHLSS